MAPRSSQDALDEADMNLEYRSQTKDDLIDSYLNGPRTLSSDRLSYLIVSQAPGEGLSGSSTTGLPTDAMNYEFLICATHFLGDGMALHQFANDFFTLLGSTATLLELETSLESEWHIRCGTVKDIAAVLPSSLEDRLVPLHGRFRSIVSRVDFQKSQEKLIGGHSFPRRSGVSRHTIVPTVSIDTDHTKKILGNCKAHGVSISSTLFALCSIAWASISKQGLEMPVMMYSALNLRPNLIVDKTMNDSYWYLAIGYFNVILPGFLPRCGDISATLWHRARSAKVQSTNAAKNPMVISRSREMARERRERACAWAKEDDEKARGVWRAQPSPINKSPERPPSTALIGLSLLGNLDGMYRHSTFPNIKLHTLTTGSRQRSGGMLLFGYTFVGKLWLSLGYDENGFDKATVGRFWDKLLSITDELMVH